MKSWDEDGGFYLGREFDLAEQKVLDEPILYEPRDLTTHGIVVGMTGSGKTGLCVSLLEEVALRGIPSVVVDLKGDLSNLLLNFPQMDGTDFEPWVDPEEARRNEKTIEECARDLARTWREGLRESGQDLARVARLRDAADRRLYSPGSEAGLPVSVLRSFAAPRGDIPREVLTEKVESTTTALLGLMNLEADPVQSREHILIANLLLNAWSAGRDMDLPGLITEIQEPPLHRIGAFDIDLFYPVEERLKLAVSLNNLLASPSFATWITGEPLDLARMLYTPEGKPRQLIFYLAHLEESQRMFFLTLLLQEMLAWTRAQAGSTSLRALLYIDEVFGYLPPHPANPPTKQPLLSLFKQARAFGVGVLLATQNPVDLDYKALTNAGTWLVGKLRTERDKDRLLEGLEGIAAEQGTLTDRGYLDTAISSLGSRIFLLHDVHRDRPQVFQTRWTLSYLHGPLTREQLLLLKKLPKPEEQPEGGNEAAPAVEAGASPEACPGCGVEAGDGASFCMKCGAPLAEAAGRGEEDAIDSSFSTAPPVLPPGTVQLYLSREQAPPQEGARLVYVPRVLAFAEVLLTDRSRKHEQRLKYHLLAEAPPLGRSVPWDEAEEITEDLEESRPAQEGITWDPMPRTINDPKKLQGLERSFVKHLYDHCEMTLFFNRSLKLWSSPEEDQEAFVERCAGIAREQAEPELSKIKQAYRDKLDEQKRVPASDVSQQAAERRLMDEWKGAVAKTQAAWQKKAEDCREVHFKPRRADIHVVQLAIGWAPFWEQKDEGGKPRREPAYRIVSAPDRTPAEAGAEA